MERKKRNVKLFYYEIIMKDIQIITFNPQTNKAQVSFSRNNSYISGRDNTRQRLVKLLLTRTKSNLFSPNFGCNLYDRIGKAYPDSGSENTTTEITNTIKKVTETMQMEQINNRFKLTTDETIKDIAVHKSEFDPIFGGWLVELEVNGSYIQI